MRHVRVENLFTDGMNDYPGVMRSTNGDIELDCVIIERTSGTRQAVILSADDVATLVALAVPFMDAPVARAIQALVSERS